MIPFICIWCLVHAFPEKKRFSHSHQLHVHVTEHDVSSIFFAKSFFSLFLCMLLYFEKSILPFSVCYNTRCFVTFYACLRTAQSLNVSKDDLYDTLHLPFSCWYNILVMLNSLFTAFCSLNSTWWYSTFFDALFLSFFTCYCTWCLANFLLGINLFSHWPHTQ